MDLGPPRTSHIELQGPFDLGEVASMGFGHRDEGSFDGVMRLAFCVDRDLEQQVGVEVRQGGHRLELTVHDVPGGGRADLDAVTRQVARITSADGDGAAFERVCARDLRLARLHAVAPGFRPALFHSPYDACVWSILSARKHRAQAITLRSRLCEQYGAGFELAGEPVHALPTPGVFAGVGSLPGLSEVAIPRLHALVDAARAGRLDVERLTSLTPQEAMADLQQLPGIGPFYSALVLVRACGLTDVLSTQERHSRDAVRRLYGLDHEPTDAELEAIAESWRPFRTWVAVMMRALLPRMEAG